MEVVVLVFVAFADANAVVFVVVLLFCCFVVNGGGDLAVVVTGVVCVC